MTITIYHPGPSFIVSFQHFQESCYHTFYFKVLLLLSASLSLCNTLYHLSKTIYQSWIESHFGVTVLSIVVWKLLWLETEKVKKNQNKPKPQIFGKIIKSGKKLTQNCWNWKAWVRGSKRQSVKKKKTGYILVSVIWTRSANDANRTIDFLKTKNEGLYHTLKRSMPILKTWNVEFYVTEVTAKDKFSLLSHFSEYWSVQGIFSYKPSNCLSSRTSQPQKICCCLPKKTQWQPCWKKKALSIRFSLPLDKNNDIEIFQNTEILHYWNILKYIYSYTQEWLLLFFRARWVHRYSTCHWIIYACKIWDKSKHFEPYLVCFVTPLPTSVLTAEKYRHRLCALLKQNDIIIGQRHKSVHSMIRRRYRIGLPDNWLLLSKTVRLYSHIPGNQRCWTHFQ